MEHRQRMENAYAANPQFVKKILQHPMVQAKKEVLQEASTAMEQDLKNMKKSQSK